MKAYQISPFIVFFMVSSAQVGVGILGFERVIAKVAGYNGWMSVIWAGILVHVIIYFIYRMFKDDDSMDLKKIQDETFGKWIGGAFNLLFALYFAFSGFTILRTYLEVIQVWMFPKIHPWFAYLLFAFPIYRAVSGGFRVVAGMCFFGFVLPYWLFFTIIIPLKYGDWTNLLPLLNHPIKDLWEGTKAMSLTYVGYETLLVYYPYIRNPKKSHKYAQWSALHTMILYLLTCIATFVFFSAEQLQSTVWAHLSMTKIIQFSFIQRFEYIKVSWWILVVIPNIMLLLWCASKLVKHTLKVNQRYPTWFFMGVYFLCMFVVDDRGKIDMLNNYNGKVGFWIVYVYIPVLFLIRMTMSKVKGKNKHEIHQA